MMPSEAKVAHLSAGSADELLEQCEYIRDHGMFLHFSNYSHVTELYQYILTNERDENGNFNLVCKEDWNDDIYDLIDNIVDVYHMERPVWLNEERARNLLDKCLFIQHSNCESELNRTDIRQFIQNNAIPRPILQSDIDNIDNAWAYAVAKEQYLQQRHVK